MGLSQTTSATIFLGLSKCSLSTWRDQSPCGQIEVIPHITKNSTVVSHKHENNLVCKIGHFLGDLQNTTKGGWIWPYNILCSKFPSQTPYLHTSLWNVHGFQQLIPLRYVTWMDLHFNLTLAQSTWEMRWSEKILPIVNCQTHQTHCSKQTNKPTIKQTRQLNTIFHQLFYHYICRRVATSLFSSTFESHSRNTQPIPKKPGKSDSFPPSRGGAPAAKKGGNMKVNDCDHL